MIRDRSHTSIKVENGCLILLDQTALPSKEVWLDVTKPEDLCSAIVRLSVRGAPLIGVAAALGLAIHSSKKNAAGKFISIKVCLLDTLKSFQCWRTFSCILESRNSSHNVLHY